MARGDDRIRGYYIFRAITSFALWMPFWTLWAYINLEDFFLLTLVDVGFWTTMIVFQIPAGLLGDKYGRKTVLFVGEIFASIGVLCFGLSHDIAGLFGSNIVWAFGICFVVSGDTPFVYDTLVELGRAKEFIGVMAKGYAVVAVANAIACITGGVIIQWIFPGRVELTLIISAVIAMFGSLTILLLKEPKTQRTQLTSYVKHFRDGWNMVVSTKAIVVLIVFQIVIEIATYVMAVFRSVYMNEAPPNGLGLGYFEIGAFIAAFAVVGGIAATQAGKIEERLGEKTSLLFLLLTIIGSFGVVFLVASPIAIIVQFPIYIVVFLQSPIIGGYINRRVDSTHRSTVVAIASLIFTAVLTAVELPAGWLAEEIGMRTTMAILAVAIAPLGLYLLIQWNREVDKSAGAKKYRTLRQF
jgi:MFS family permease